MCVRFPFIVFQISVLLPFTLLHAQFTNVRVSDTTAVAPEEVTIAINPSNPSVLIAGSNLRYFFQSSDGGMTWMQGQLPPGTWGDPCVTFGGSGSAVYGHLANLASGYFIDRLILHRSSDNGMTWGDSSEVGYNAPKQQDKEWIAFDPSNSSLAYMGWTQFDAYGSTAPGDSSRILFSRTTDGGAMWSAPEVISDAAGDCLDEDNTVEGAVPAVGPNGEVYVAWSGPGGIRFDRSTDGGVTFGNDTFVTTQPGGWDFSIPGIYRANGLPVTVCDVSSSPYRGTVYVLFADQRNGIDNTDVFLVKSTDGGDTWGTPVRVNTDMTTSHQFFPAIDIDQTTGYIYVVYYDRRNTSGNETDVYLSRSTDGGETFTDKKVSESPFDPQATTFFGDYIDIAAYNRVVHPIWMRLDGNALSVWSAAVVDTGNTLLPIQLSSFTATLVQGPGVRLDWTTLSEVNNYGFEVQRLADSSFATLPNGFVPGNGTTTAPHSYSYTDIPETGGQYSYRLKQIDLDGSVYYSEPVGVTVTSVAATTPPLRFSLHQNYPNPFNPSTTIRFSIPSKSDVSLRVFNQLGEVVATLINGTTEAGQHDVIFDNPGLATGVYYYRLQAGEYSSTKRMVVLK
jgi:Secretion system C-terminal sorting domain